MHTVPNSSLSVLSVTGAARAARCIVSATPLAAILLLAGSAHASPWHEDVTASPVYNEVNGDFDGDGKPDRVVSFPDHEHGRGLVAILWGTGAAQDYTYYSSGIANVDHKYVMDANLGGIVGISGGLANTTRIDLEGPIAAAADVPSAPWTHLGSSLAVGDFDADGLDDLVIGVPGAEVPMPQNQNLDIFSAGQVWVLYGADMAADILDPEVWHQDTPGIQGVSETQDFFGEVVATGDVNCDGFDDLIVGAPREDYSSAVDAGTVHVIHGSAAGVHATGNQVFYQGSAGITETAEAHDHFGAALTTGTFNGATFVGMRECASLAIGAPGEDLLVGGGQVADAGVVHVLNATNYPSGGVWNGTYASIGAAGGALFHQNTGSLLSAPEAGDQFGARLGKVGVPRRLGAARYDNLWVGVPGENWACPTQDEIGTTQILASSSAGLKTTGDKMLCQSVRPDLVAAEAGVVVEKVDAYGKWLQYVPANLNAATAKLMIVAPGTNDVTWAYDAREDETFTAARGNANKYLNYPGWIAAADALNLIVIVPQFEEWNFGNTSTYTDGTGGGYRSLFGHELGANRWVELIADRYAEVGLGDGRFYLLGHSAGGQFTNRYVMHNQNRLLGAAIMSPQNVTRPTAAVSWPNGLGAYAGNDAWALANPIVPNAASAEQTLQQVPVYYVVGELETPANNPDTPNYPNRVKTARDWVDEVWANYSVAVPLCVIENGSHSSSNNHRSGLVGLFPSLANHPVFINRPKCMVAPPII
jgi:hypothetical protein